MAPVVAAPVAGSMGKAPVMRSRVQCFRDCDAAVAGAGFPSGWRCGIMLPGWLAGPVQVLKPMPPLPNARHERFCQELATGQSKCAAYEAAGYAPRRDAASRLSANANIQARVRELKAAGAERAEVTIASLVAELDSVRRLALLADTPQASAAVAAIMAKARLLGFLDRKVDVQVAPVSVIQLMAVSPARDADDERL